MTRTGSQGPPESLSRKRAKIPERPSRDEAKSIVGEVARRRGFQDPELEITLQHMIDAIFDQFDPIWEALDILDKRHDEFEQEDPTRDTEFKEINRSTQRRKRIVESDDGDIQITVLDVITQDVTLRGNKTGTKVKYIFREPLPV